MAFEKPLKDFLEKFQKDLNVLQKTLKREGDDLVKKVKTAANRDNLQAKRKDIELVIEKNLKKYEPTINKFVSELNTSAKKAGVDLSDLEKKVKDNLHAARAKLSKTGETVKAKATKAKAGATKAGAKTAKKASAKKAAARKVPGKKTAAKKSDATFMAAAKPAETTTEAAE